MAKRKRTEPAMMPTEHWLETSKEELHSDNEELSKEIQATRELNKRLEQRIAERTELLRLVQDTANAANEGASIEEVIRYTLARLCEQYHWHLAHMYRLADDGTDEFVPTGIFYTVPGKDYPRFREVTLRTRFPKGGGKGLIKDVLRSGKPQWIEDIAKSNQYIRDDEGDLGLKSVIAFPVRVLRDIIAVLEFYSDEMIRRDDRYMVAMEAVATQIGHLIQRKRLEKEIAEFAEREQRRIGQELHDSLGQQISAIGMIATSLAHTLTAKKSPAADSAARLVKLIDATKHGLGDIIHALLPVEIDASGLSHALRSLADQTAENHGVECRFKCSEPVSIPDNFLATQLFLIAREATHNAVKHAQAKRIVIRMRQDGGETLSIEDDGQGIQADLAKPDGEGIRIMRRRAELIDGKLNIESRKQGGTVVTCSLRSSLFE